MNRDSGKIGRNDDCPCGSGLKYKKCCISGKGRVQPVVDLKLLYSRRYGIKLKDEKDIEGIRKAGFLVMEAHRLVESQLKSGMSTNEINTIVHEYTVRNGAVPAPLNYRGFPKSVCVSVNDVICHGIPGEYILKDGDIVNVDITTILDGYYADANLTYFIGKPGPDALKIVNVARESLKRGLAMVRPGNTIGDIGAAIQKYAEGEKCSVVREYVGHGIGFDFHENPQVMHYGRKGTGVQLVPGMVFTVEPMINLGAKELFVLSDQWTAKTKDGSLSAQFEQTVVVTDYGYESLTPYEL